MSRKKPASTEFLIPTEAIERRIYLLRGRKGMLDNDLAELYHVQTKVLNQAVTRNRSRFPGDFMFRLTREEFESLRSQIVTSNVGRGGRRYPPRVFTEQGVAMLSSVLRSERAIQVNIAVLRAFVRLRGMLASSDELRRKLAAMEKKLEGHDVQIQTVFEAIRELMAPDPKKARRIGFQPRN